MSRPYRNQRCSKGILKKMEPIKFRFLASVPDPTKTEIYYLPLVDWNTYDRLMVGSAFYSSIIPQKRFEYLFIPQYSFGAKSLAGNAEMAYNWFPIKGKIQIIKLSTSVAQYSYVSDPGLMRYQKVAPELNITFKNQTPRNGIIQSVSLRSITIFKEKETAFVPYRYCFDCAEYTIGEVNYTLQNKRAINPYSAKLTTEFGKGFSKQFIELKYKISYAKRKKGVEFRSFTGFFFDNSGSDLPPINLSGPDGARDYKFDESFIGRSETEGKWSRQFSVKEGGFKSETFYGVTDKWLSTFNVKVAFPSFLPIGVFADAGTFSEAKSILKSQVLYDAGAYISIGEELFEIYFPVFFSNEVKQVHEFRDIGFKEKIRFVINLNFINPLEIGKNISF